MTTEEFDKANHYRELLPECCLTCKHAVRWAFESRYSEDPSELRAMCLSEDAPHEQIRFGGPGVERKYVNPFHVCDCYKRDKEIK